MGGGNSRQNLNYVFDAVGNLTSRNDANAGLTESFGYDNLYRLTSASVNGGTPITVAYAANGNITNKSDVGAYSYGSRLHAVATAGGNSFGYDANGNVTSKNGAAVSWYADNKPQSIAGNGQNSTFEYTPGGAYWRQTATYAANPSGTETTTYIAGLLEIVVKGGVANFRHHINANGRTVAIVNRTGGTTSTSYLLTDHLGSVDTVTDASGNVVVKESFDAWGKRRNPATWAGAISASDEASIASTTRCGYTGHTELDNVGLVHMNGRVYDPTIGRFLSADPFVQAPLDTQSWNRFTYVRNSPLSLTDPSGYSWFSRALRNLGDSVNRLIGDLMVVVGAITEVIVPGNPFGIALINAGQIIINSPLQLSYRNGRLGISMGMLSVSNRIAGGTGPPNGAGSSGSGCTWAGGCGRTLPGTSILVTYLDGSRYPSGTFADAARSVAEILSRMWRLVGAAMPEVFAGVAGALLPSNGVSGNCTYGDAVDVCGRIPRAVLEDEQQEDAADANYHGNDLRARRTTWVYQLRVTAIGARLGTGYEGEILKFGITGSSPPESRYPRAM